MTIHSTKMFVLQTLGRLLQGQQADSSELVQLSNGSFWEKSTKTVALYVCAMGGEGAAITNKRVAIVDSKNVA